MFGDGIKRIRELEKNKKKVKQEKQVNLIILNIISLKKGEGK